MSVFAVLAAVTFTGVTSNPTNGCFALGQPVELTLAATGLAPRETRTLSVEVCDEHETVVRTVPVAVAADAHGGWKTTVRLPSDRFGFFRVVPKDGGKSVLPKEGSRPAGCLTYAVLHDPATRRLYPQDETFFGIHGCTADEARWMGARVSHGYGSPVQDEKGYAQFRADYEQGRIGWRQYGFIGAHAVAEGRYRDLFPAAAQEFVRTNLNQWAWFGDPVREAWLSEALEKLARRAKVRDYGRAHGYVRRCYEIEWEPELSAPSLDFIVRRARLSHAAIHRGDPEAIVMGPTLSTMGAVSQTRELFEKGLADCIDAYCVHAYNECPPEPNDFIGRIRRTKALVAEHMGPKTLLFGTEDGCCRPPTMEGELDQLYGMVRKGAIMLGEGFAFNCPFYGYDHGRGEGGPDYGFCYNLTLPQQRWAPPRISPRPVFAGLSALSWYLEGHRPTCTIEWLGETVHGYAYQNRDGHCILALWDWGGNASEVEIPVGRDEVAVGDVFGNERRVRTADGKLRLGLSAAIQYVPDVSPEIWGCAAQAKLQWSRRKFRSAAEDAPLRLVSARPSFASGGAGVSVEIENTTGAELSGVVSTRIYGKPSARRDCAVTVPAGRTKRVEIAFDAFKASPFAVEDVEIAVEPAKGMRIVRSFPFNFLAAPRVKGKWTSPDYHDVPVVGVPAQADNGHHPAAMKAAFGWNARYLLLDIVVEDDSFVQPHHNWHTWKGDSIQIGFARDKDVKRTANDYADDLNRALTEHTVALTETGAEVYRTMTFDKAKFPSGGIQGMTCLDPKEVPCKVVKTDLPGGGVRLRYCIAFPWRLLNVAEPRPGLTCHFAALVNDADAGANGLGRAGIFELKGMMPRKFGTLVLEDAK